MNSKERANTAIKLKQPDRVPVDYWADKLITQRLMKALDVREYEKLLKRHGIDFRYIEGTVYTGPELEKFEDGSACDIWGVRRKTVMIDPQNPEKGSYEHVIDPPLASAQTVKDIESYGHWPSPGWYDYSQVASMCKKHDGYAVVCGGDRLNRTAQLKPAMYLRGVEQAMLDLALNPRIMEAIFERLVDFYLEYNRNIFENARGGIDIFFMGDDFGTQNGLMTSIEMWRKFIKPGFKKFIDLAHSYGIAVMHHTCGAIAELIPDFIDCGLDILQSLQPRAKGMDLKKIKEEYGKYICFQGGIDIQNTLPYGTPADVTREVIERIKTMAPGGGYILCSAHNIQADVPVENVLAMYKAALEHGKY
ncbi:MAG: hypothetical protein GX754_09315 [Clostridiaceae bacterium]|nr:hypothetical protein [Clostridiaceae bacterium]